MWHSTSDPPSIVYSAEEAAAMDVWLVEERGYTIPQLMAQAGGQLAATIRELAAAHGLDRVVHMVGPGNNGGDARVACEQIGRELDQVLWEPLVDPTPPLLDGATLVVDGLFGVGLARPVTGNGRRAVDHVNTSPSHVLAVDIPSGLSATTGEIVGASVATPDGGVAVKAHHTLTFVGAKRGFFLDQGPSHVGLWRAVDIGFPVDVAHDWLRSVRERKRLG